MKRLIGNLILVLVLAGMTDAEGGVKQSNKEGSVFILGGYGYIQAAAIQPFVSELKGVGIPIVDVGVEIPITSKISGLPAFYIYRVNSSITFGTARGELNPKNYQLPLLVRVYTSEPGRARGFIQAGPSVNFLKIEASATGIGADSFNNSVDKTKLGATFQAGVLFPFNKRVAFEGLAGYSYVSKHETLNMSSFGVMGGIAILWREK